MLAELNHDVASFPFQRFSGSTIGVKQGGDPIDVLGPRLGPDVDR